MNSGQIIGRLVRDIELTYTKNNKELSKGSLAINDDYNKEKTHFFNFTAFGKTAATMAQYLKKGDQVAINYKLNHNIWQTQDGQKRSTVDLTVLGFTFIGNKKSDTQQPQSNQQNQGANKPDDFADFEDVSDQVGDNEISF